MSEGEDVYQQIPNLSRGPIKISVAICGGLAGVGVMAAIYTYVNTRGIYVVPIYVGHELQREESIEVYLFSLPVFQLFVFAMAAYPCLTWTRFIRKISMRQTFWTAQFEELRHLNIGLLYKVICACLCIVAAGLLVATLYRCNNLLNTSL